MSDQQKTLEELLAWCGGDATKGTRVVLEAFLRKGAETDLARVRESMATADPENRAAWLVGALKSARAERLADREDTSSAGDLARLAHRLEKHLREAQGMVTAMQELAASLPVAQRGQRYACPECLVEKKSERAIAEHMALVHDGPAIPMTPEEIAAA